MLTIVALICHLVTVSPETTIKSCHEEIVAKDLPMQACTFAQMGIAQWKAASRFADDEYTVEGYKCAVGSGYVLKDDRI